MRFFGNVLGTFITQVLIVGFNLLIGVLTARALGPEGRGVLTLVMTLPLTLVALADPGVTKANIYFIARRKRSPSLVIGQSIFLALTMGLLAGGGLWLMRSLALDTFLRSVPAVYLGMILALAPLVLAYAYGMSVLRALQRFVLFNSARLLMPLLTLIAIVSALFLFDAGLDGATAGYGLGTALAVAGTLWIVFRLAPPRFRLDLGLLKETLRYGGKSYVQNLIGHLTYRLDIYMVAYFLSPREVAFYGIATSVAEVLWYIPDSVGLVLFPKLSATDEEQVHGLTAEVCRHTLLITFLGAGAILVVGTLGIPLLYGPEFQPAVQPFLLLVPGVAVMMLYKVLARNFSSRNRQQISILAASAGLLLNAGLDWVLIPRLGTVGAAVASTLGYSAAGLLLLLAFHRESGVGWIDTLWLRPADLIRYRNLWRRVQSRLTRVGR